MSRIWEFFEHMDELVYVTDMDTYELIYMNKRARDTYGFQSPGEIRGKRCYETLQNCSAPCSICNNHELMPGRFKEWWYYNPLFNKNLMIKDTMIEEDGRRYRMEMALDTGGQEQRDYQNLEAMINEGLRVALLKKTPSQTLEVLLEYMGKALDGERTYIFEKNEQGGDDNTYEWVASGVHPEQENLQNVPPEVCANWYQNFKVGRHIIIKDLEEIRVKDPLQYENLKRQKIHSLVVVPLYNDGEAIGFYGVDNPPVKSLDYVSDMLQIMAHFIVSSLKRRNLIRELRKMSYCDQLTGIGNRHAMCECIESIHSEQSVGIIYCDITGLKQINDREGHGAGDQLIINACESLKTYFGEYGLFRIGGDELLAICLQIEEPMLWKGIEQMRKDLRNKSVHMAIGAVWEESCAAGIDRLMAEAEKKMYIEKTEYYKKRGIVR